MRSQHMVEVERQTKMIAIIYFTIELEVEVTRITIPIFHLNECVSTPERHSSSAPLQSKHVNYTVTAFASSVLFERKRLH